MSSDLIKVLGGIVGSVLSLPMVLISTGLVGVMSFVSSARGSEPTGMWMYFVFCLLLLAVYLVPIFTAINYVKPDNSLARMLSVVVLSCGCFTVLGTLLVLIGLPEGKGSDIVTIIFVFNLIPSAAMLYSGILQFKDYSK